MRLLAIALIASGCARVTPLDQAERFLRTGRFRDALLLYGDLAKDREPRVQVLALCGAARAASRLRDPVAARRYLERAVAIPEVGGASEEAYYEYAERLRADGDRPRALQFYYRAAAGADQHRARGFPWKRAVDAIAALSMAP